MGSFQKKKLIIYTNKIMNTLKK